MKIRRISLSLILLGTIALATSCSAPEDEREADGLDKLMDAARQERGRGLSDLDVTKPLPELIKDVRTK